MRELARIQFRGDSYAFEAAWNIRSDHKIKYGLIAIHKDDPAYVAMRQLFDQYALSHTMSWYERVYAKYSAKELASYELLQLDIVGRAGVGNNEFANVYVTELACRVCGRVSYRQIRDLVLDFTQKEPDRYETPYFQHDICKTDFFEVIITRKLKELLEVQGVPGISFRPIEAIPTQRSSSKLYFQLLVEPTIGSIVEPTRIQRLRFCANCGQYQEVLLDALPGTKESEFCFPRASYARDQIMKTVDEFGRGPRYEPKLIISQDMYRLMRRNRISGFVVQPVHLV